MSIATEEKDTNGGARPPLRPAPGSECMTDSQRVVVDYILDLLGEVAAERNQLLELVKECEGLLTEHHCSSLCTFNGKCPVCSKNHTEHYPHNIFGRIERVLRPQNGKLTDGYRRENE